MFRNFKRVTCVAMLLAAPLQANVIDRVVVVVNDQIITAKELDRAFMAVKQQYEQTFQGEELHAKLMEARKMILERMIEQLLIYQEAVQKGIKVKSADIERSVEEIKVQFGTEQKFVDVLRVQGISEKNFRESVKRRMYSKRYRDSYISQGIRVRASEMKDFYDQHKIKYRDSAEIRASQIFISFGNESEKAFARKKTEQVLQSLKSGENFEDLARQFSKGPNASKGGDLGFLKNGQMLEEVEDALSQMFIGDISPPVESSAGFHILKLISRKQPRQMLLSEVEDRVRQRVFAQKAEDKYHKTLRKLRKKAFIEYKAELS